MLILLFAELCSRKSVGAIMAPLGNNVFPEASYHRVNPIKVKPGPRRPGLNEKSCQIDMNRLNLFSIGDFSS